MKVVSDHMVETVVHARMWQTLRTIRRTMMENEVSHLPFENEGQWYTVCAEALCVYRDQHREEGKEVWGQTLRVAIERTDKWLDVRNAVLVDLSQDITRHMRLKGQGSSWYEGNATRESSGC